MMFKSNQNKHYLNESNILKGNNVNGQLDECMSRDQGFVFKIHASKL